MSVAPIDPHADLRERLTELLRHHLASVEKEGARAVLVVRIGPGLISAFDYAGDTNWVEVLGSLEMLKQEVIARIPDA